MTAFPTFPIQASRLVSAFRGDYNDITTLMLQAFQGPDEPSPRFSGMSWIDTSVTPKLLKQRNTANSAWIIRARIDQDWGGGLPLIGGTMEGAVDMGGFGLVNLPLGSGNAAARYSDLAAYAKLDGDGSSGPVFTKTPLVPATDPVLSEQVTRKNYVDRVAHAGGSFTAQIVMPDPATNASHLVRKQEFDNSIANHSHSGAAGQGPKIPAANFGVSGASVGDVPRVTSLAGGGAAAWAPPGRVNDHFYNTVVSTGTTIGWTTVNATALFPAYARIALLFITMTSEWTSNLQRYTEIFLRKYQSPDSISYQNIPIVSSGAQQQIFKTLAMIEMDDLRFDWQTIAHGDGAGRGNADMKLLGYL